MRKTNKQMRDDYYITRRIISIDPMSGEYIEMKDNTRTYLYSEWDKNRGIKYVPKNKKGGRHVK